MLGPSRTPGQLWLVVGSCAVLIGVVAGLAWRASRSSVQGDWPSDSVGPQLPSVALVAPEREAVAPRTAMTPAASDAAGAAAAVPLYGRVLDDLFGLPVLARIEPDIGSSVFSDAETGNFRSSADSASWTKLRVTADGFEDVLIEAQDTPANRGLQIRLRGARYGSVIVKYTDGIPAVGVTVAWRSVVEIPFSQDPQGWIDSRTQLRGEVVKSRTDIEGLARKPLASAAIAIVEDPRGRATRAIRIDPGEDTLVVLPEDFMKVRFVDHRTREPARDLELDAWCPRDPNAMSQPLITDADGVVTIWPTSFPVWMRRRGSRTYQSELIPLSPGVSRCGMDRFEHPATMVRIDGTTEEPILVGVRASGIRVKLVDEASEEPVDADVRVCERLDVLMEGGRRWYATSASVMSPRAGPSPFERCFRARDGELLLPVDLRRPEELIRGIKKVDTPVGIRRSELVLIAQGYHPYRVQESTDVAAEVDQTPVFKLKPARQRSLRLVHPDGSAYAGSMHVYSAEKDVLCFSSSGESDGIYGPFDWMGGPLGLSTLREHGPGWTVPEANLAASDSVSFTLSFKMGAIAVVDIPEDASHIAIVAAAEGSLDHWPDTTGAGSCHFHSIPAGAYVVGPVKWVRGATMQTVVHDDDLGADRWVWSDVSTRVVVKPGETTVVRWREEWDIHPEIEGRVRILSPAHIEPFLVPYYGRRANGPKTEHANAPRMGFSGRSPRIALDRDGNYRIPPSEPLPSLIAVCVADETVWADANGLHVLEVIKPGESAEIPTGSVELSLKGPSYGVVSVSYDLPEKSWRHPLFTSHVTCENSWAMDRVLRLHGIPLHVKELEIERRMQPIELEAGKVIPVEVELSKLRYTQRNR